MLPPGTRGLGAGREGAARGAPPARRDRRAGASGRGVPRPPRRGPRGGAHVGGLRATHRALGSGACTPGRARFGVGFRAMGLYDRDLRSRPRRDRRAFAGSRRRRRLRGRDRDGGRADRVCRPSLARTGRRDAASSAQAQALRGRVEKLAEANEEAYLEAIALIEGAEEGGGRDEAIGQGARHGGRAAALDRGVRLRRRAARLRGGAARGPRRRRGRLRRGAARRGGRACRRRARRREPRLGAGRRARRACAAH